MQSFEVLKDAVAKIGAKAVAAEMSVSPSLVYKWCESSERPGGSGADNPLDRVERICRITDDPGPIAWLCQKSNGFFVRNPPLNEESHDPLLASTRQILQEFSELLDAVSSSVEDDGCVDSAEAEKIRREWEDLKGIGERFVSACEHGQYAG